MLSFFKKTKNFIKHPFLQELSGLIILATTLLVSPLYGQHNSVEDPEESLIQKGKVLTGFSFSFINASRDDFNQEFEREFTDISLQLEGLYFLSDRIGIGPLLGYRFTYRDLEDPFRGGTQSDSDTRAGQFEFGIKGGWYIPATKLLGSAGDTQFFVDGGLSFLREKSKQEGRPKPDANYRFGYQFGTGFLFPMGKGIIIETKLGFQSRRREFRIRQTNPDGEDSIRTITKWPKEIALSVGFKVSF